LKREKKGAPRRPESAAISRNERAREVEILYATSDYPTPANGSDEQRYDR